ncbi:helix-turn-helix transcriptional regulator [Chryseobacterium wanjuense]
MTSVAIIVITFNIKHKFLRKKHENDIQGKQLNTSDDDIIQLAINDDPTFMMKFREHYSEFYNNMTTSYTALTVNDMKFIAYVRLKFSNKEIAQYGNMSIRTVESKKYRLRKKLNLSPDTDFNQWIWNQ